MLDGLFESGHETRLSGLKNKFYDDLAKAKKALYRDAVERGWFPRNPNTVRTVTRILGIFGMLAGMAVTIWLAGAWGAGLVGLPFVVGGLFLALISGAMPRRTAKGTHLMRRSLGFARYIRTAETHQQAFAERANLFTAYLPYAIVFKCVDKWAQAFKDIDLQQATGRWYAVSPHSMPAHSRIVSTAFLPRCQPRWRPRPARPAAADSAAADRRAVAEAAGEAAVGRSLDHLADGDRGSRRDRPASSSTTV